MNRECDDASGGSASANMPSSDASGTGTPGTDWAAGEHGALIRRARAILDGTLASVDLAVLIDSAQAGSAQASRQAAPVVALERASQPGLARLAGKRRFALRYNDPLAQSTLCALIACATPAGSPIAADPESLSVLALAERLAASDIPVLINGPTGTGKEVLSRFIHAASPRKDGPFIAINCAAMPETMLEALLLDEIAEMPLPLQAKLLRALQEGEVVPLGATQPVKVDVRVIACANRDLPAEVEEGRFRADLYYRLNVFPLTLHALADRPDDIGPLAFALMLRHTAPDRPTPWICDEALAMLARHTWPGNVRELENVVRRALLLAGNAAEVGPEHIVFDRPARSAATEAALADANQTRAANGKLSNIVQLSEARAILATLEACGGSRVAAARELGISERTLRYRLASFREAGIAVAGGRR